MFQVFFTEDVCSLAGAWFVGSSAIVNTEKGLIPSSNESRFGLI